jgi:nucleoside-diphosphate-sugar epimerase
VRNLVTGASGFLGSHLVEGLVRDGEDVVALVRRSSDRTHLVALGAQIVDGDLVDRSSLAACLEGVDRVFHCAALVSDWGTWQEFRATNVTGLANLLEAADQARVERFVHVSSTDVYGHPDRVLDEHAPFRRRGWPYGDTKIEAEELFWRFVRERGLNGTVVRPASLYGPRSRSFVDEVLELLRERRLPLIGPADRAAGLTEVTNAVDAILLIASSEQTIGRAYNVTDGSRVGWQTYFERLAQIADVPPPRRFRIPRAAAYPAAWAVELVYRGLRLRSRPPLTRLMVELLATEQGFSNARLETELAYRPRLAFDEGMQRLEAWLRMEGRIPAPSSRNHKGAPEWIPS